MSIRRLQALALAVLSLALLMLALLVAPATTASPRGADLFRRLKVGQTATLTGGDYGQSLRVRLTLLKVVDPARSPYYRPRKGTRFLAFKLRCTNTGKNPYVTTPTSEAELLDSRGTLYDSASSLTGGSIVRPWPVFAPDLNHGLKLGPGKTWTAWMGWIVPAKLRLREFRYTLPFGHDTAAWVLGP